MALLLKKRIYYFLRSQKAKKEKEWNTTNLSVQRSDYFYLGENSNSLHVYKEIINKLSVKTTSGIKTRRIDIRQHPANLDKIVNFSLEGYGIWFSCGGIIAVGGAFPEIMDLIIAPAKRYAVKVYNKKLISTNKKELRVPKTRKFENKPPIMLVTLKYMFQVVDLEWLARKYRLKNSQNVKELLTLLYSNTLLHMILPIKKDYYDLFPFNKNNPTKDKVVAAGFMCLGGYPPLKEFIVRHEKKAEKKINDLPWPFMGTSLSHHGTEPVVTSQQAHEYLEELGHEAKKIIVIFEDSKMDSIVENEWKRGGSQSIIDLVNGESKKALIVRRGTAVPEIAKDILNKFKIKLVYKHGFKDLYKDQDPPIMTQQMMKEFIKRLKL